MSKRKNRQQALAPEKEAESLYDAAGQQARNHNLPDGQDLPSPSGLGDAVKQARVAKRIFDELTKEVSKSKESAEREARDLEDRKRELAGQEARLNERRADVSSREEEVAEERRLLDERQHELLRTEESLVTREAEADAGFLNRYQGRLGEFEASLAEVRADVEQDRERLREARLAWERQRQQEQDALNAELDERRRQHEEALQEKTQQLEQDLDRLANAERDLKQRARVLSWRDAELDELAEDLEVRIERRAAARIEELTAELEARAARLEAARAQRDELQASVDAQREADRARGGRSEAEILAELKDLRADRDALRKELASRPASDERDRLRQLEQERDSWEQQRVHLLANLKEHEARLARAGIAVTEIETLREQKSALEAAVAAYRADIEQRRQEFQELTSTTDAETPFPTFQLLDEDPELQYREELSDTPPDLVALLDEIQQRIAAPRHGQPLYYGKSTLRSFLGGLAMSQLHLLHGISGTGKSSLPLVFADAVGAGHALVEVQAGWRDRQDLLGHFNEFEKRFHGTEFVRALYKAQCPRWEDQPFFIVLDEMNLSHPEQYFADFLSALERRRGERIVHIVDDPHPRPPKLFSEGHKLAVPDNIWFIGTANHDETTREFAPKTYDRAHVMELPRHPKRISAKRSQARPAVSVHALRNAFARAHDTNRDQADQAYSYLDEHLAGFLSDTLGIGWGNRLERQMSDYVPVIVASGGSVGEAVDHILASKLLYKLKGRFDLKQDDLVALAEQIRGTWPDLETGGRDGPASSLAAVQQELRRLGATDALTLEG